MTPKTVTIAGIIVAVGGALLVVFGPDLVVWLTKKALGDPVGQPLWQALEGVVQVIRVVVPPIGAALIGAGVVMAYLKGSLAAIGVDVGAAEVGGDD